MNSSAEVVEVVCKYAQRAIPWSHGEAAALFPYFHRTQPTYSTISTYTWFKHYERGAHDSIKQVFK